MSLQPPLYYAWPIALRFELNADNPTLPYDKAVLLRATTLYEAAFAATDLTYILGIYEGRTGYGRYAPRQQSVFDLSRTHALGLGHPSGRSTVSFLDNPDAKARWAEVAPRLIDYSSILEAIAKHDYIFLHKLTDRVFFYNQTRNLILHMYDDRGLDLIATTRAALQPIHDAHQSWLLPDAPRTADFRTHRLKAVGFAS